MAQNVTINGQNYSAVPAVQIPKTGGGTAQFTDVSDTTAVAADVNSGKYIYLANGSKVQGSQDIYSITENLTRVTSNNNSSRILGGTSYVSEIKPTDGYLITSVMVTMGGVDITDTVFIGDTGSGGGGITPTGTINISQNGSVDVTNYASANVNVPNSYSASDEGKVVSNGALVAQSSDTVTQNGTVDTTLINSLTVNVPTGGSGVKSGSFTPSSRTLSVTFDTGLSTINGILIVPKNANPLKSNGRTAIAIIITPNDYYKSIHICSNNNGSAFLTPNASTSSTRMTQSGSNVTVTTVSNVGGYFETVEYSWYAW